MPVRYRWQLLSQADGRRLGLYATAAAQPDAVQWSRRLNGMGRCRIQVARGHDLESLIDPQEPSGVLLMDRGVTDSDGSELVPFRTEWAGIIRDAEIDDAPESESTAYTAYSLEWLATARRVLWDAEIEGTTRWSTATRIAAIATTLVEKNLGAGATTAAGRWVDGRPDWPPVAVAATGTDTVAGYATADDSVAGHLQDLAAIHDYAFLWDWHAGGARLRFGPRPLGTDRTTGAARQFIARRWGQVERLRLRTTLHAVPTLAVVRHQQAVGVLPSAPGTPGTSHTIAALTDAGLAYETLVTQASSDVPATVEASRLLDESQRQAIQAEVELNLARMIYGIDFDLGDRLQIEARPGQEPLAAEVTGVSATVTMRRGEVLDVTIAVPHAGIYG